MEICRRARVQRGTMLHHFPEREALMVAAVEHVFEERLATMERWMGKRREAPDVGALLRVLFDPRSDPTTLAWLELIVAARTDPALRRALVRMMRTFDARIAAALGRWFGPRGARGELVWRFALALQNGLVLDRIAGYDHGTDVAAAFGKIAGSLT